MKLKLIITFLIAVGLLSLWAADTLLGNSNSLAVIPLPQKMERHKGAFVLKANTRIVADTASQPTGDFLAGRLRKSTGFPLPFNLQTDTQPAKGSIVLTTRGAKAGKEGYELTVTPDSIVIRGADAAGVFYGAQTLLQLLPPEIFASQPVKNVTWSVPCVAIEDQPRFAWRGFLWDVSRHFFNKAEIEAMLDAMALHKLNVFQWHLVDDQGWRIEIKKYPRLTEIGAWRKSIGFDLDPKASTAYGPDGRYGGFYTQNDIREVIAYAQARHIAIVPEIEMPGHSSAALTAFPELSCSGGPYSTDSNEGVFAGIYCVGKEESFEFVQNVLAEVCDLFPSKYIHIGGDEVPPENWKGCARCQARMKQEGLKNERELESYFIRRVEKFLNSRSRNLIGWSEIREGGLAPNAAIMDWIGGAVEAASAGHDVVMTPTKCCYFDYYQATNCPEPKAIGDYLPLNVMYSFEPIPSDLPAQFQSHIIGTQGNLWSEYVPSLKHAQYMAFPRLCALAEIAWSPKAGRSYEDFTHRLRTHFRRFDQLGVNYRKPIPGPNE
jgi:hexosaminidase